MNTHHIKEFILSQFEVPNDSYSLIKNSNGLINKSYSVLNSDGLPVYFLQEIDKNVFKNIDGLMSNIGHITKHFQKLEHRPRHLELINTTSNQAYLKTNMGRYWRLYTYCSGKSYDIAENDELAATAGKAFGEFLKGLESTDLNKLTVTIPNFHNISFRYKQFTKSIKNADQSRLVKSKELIELVDNNIQTWVDFYQQLSDNCTLRPTHNDTKLNNLLISETGPPIVVDYDTIMPGYIALDYGDAVRTICSTTAEDDKDLSKVNYRLNLINAFTSSFIQALNLSNNSEELNFLARATSYMPFLMGLRMLTDYLNNDIYYSTNYTNHNFDRAKNQFKLYRKGTELLEEIESIITLKNQ